MERTEGDEDDHPDTDVNLATAVPVLEDGAGGIDVVWGDDKILHEVIVTEGEPYGGVDETGSIAGEAALVGNVGGHFTERDHDKVTDEADEAVPEEETEWTASAGVGFESTGRRLAEWRERLTGQVQCRIR